MNVAMLLALEIGVSGPARSGPQAWKEVHPSHAEELARGWAGFRRPVNGCQSGEQGFSRGPKGRGLKREEE